MYYADGEYMYFMMFFEDDPNPTTDTYGVVMNDGASDNNYDFMVCTVYMSGTQYIGWYSWVGGFTGWSNTGSTSDTDWLRFSTTNGQEHVAFAVAYSVTFTPVPGEDYFKGVTDGHGATQGSGWARNPTPSAEEGDYTTAGTIPEFSNIFIPIASVALIVGNRIRSKKTNQQ